jgi:chemotaxis protein methyltransferase CheR
LGLDSYTSYVQYVMDNFELECSHFCNAITTNLTSFFRENHHFDFLTQTGLPQLLRKSPRKLRVWSAGCSTGQEAYCLAITLLKAIPDALARDIKILATDLDENCLATARAGAYCSKDFERVDPRLITEFFNTGHVYVKSMKRDAFVANDRLRAMITFNKLNLMQPWPMHGKFDVIFCRNVFIYFDKATQEKILKNFAKFQDPGSYLCLGHSETVPNPGALGYQLIGKTTYLRK